MRLFTAVFITVLFSPCAIAGNIPLDDAGFTSYVAELAVKNIGNADVSVKGPLNLEIGEMQANLQRMQGFCKNNSESSCLIEINRFVRTVNEIIKEKNAPLDENAIQLVVRTREYIKHAETSLGANGPQIQYRSFTDSLVLMAVLDTPKAIRPLDDRDLNKLGLGQDQLFELASKNLEKNLEPLIQKAKQVKAGQIGTIKGSVYEPGRLALSSQWQALADLQHGVLLVSLPTTDMILYVSESSPVAVDALRSLAINIARKSPNPLAPNHILHFNAGKWHEVP